MQTVSVMEIRCMNYIEKYMKQGHKESTQFCQTQDAKLHRMDFIK